LVEGNLGRNPFDRKRMAVLRGQGKPARTRYRVLEPFASGEPGEKPFARSVECRLETGRTHQIRVHLAHIGHPLIGDSTYGRHRQSPRAKTPAQKIAYEAAVLFRGRRFTPACSASFIPHGRPSSASNLLGPRFLQPCERVTRPEGACGQILKFDIASAHISPEWGIRLTKTR
jgi:hypothetical protein